MATTTLKRVLLLCTLLLLALTVSASVAKQNYETFEAFDNATLAAADSGCRLYQQAEQCGQAFRNTLG